MGKLQWLLSTLSEAGVLPIGNTKGKQVIVIDEEPKDPPKDPQSSRPKDPPTDVDSADDDQPSTLGKDIGPAAPKHTKGPPRGLNFVDKEVQPTLDEGFGSGCPSIGFGSFRAHTILPKSKPRPPREEDKGFFWRLELEEKETSGQREYFFEAYYIIPRSVPRNQPRGQIQLTKPVADDYMIICLDTKQDYRKDPNLRNALRKAKRARASVTASAVGEFPRSVREAALSLANHRKRHANGLTWSLVEGVELRCLEESMFRKPSSKSGFLIVFRGSSSQGDVERRAMPPPPSILKGSARNVINRPVSYGDPAPQHFPTQKSGERTPSLAIVVSNGFPKSSRRDSPERKASQVEEPPTSPEPEQVTAADIRPSSVKSAPEETKKKRKVEFDNIEHLKSERLVSRPLPGPVLYDPARSKLLPETPGSKYAPGYEYYNRNYPQPSFARRHSMRPPAPQAPLAYSPQPYYPASGPPPALQSPPLSQTHCRRFPSAQVRHGTFPSHAMEPAPPQGWTASSQPPGRPGAPIVVPTSSDSEAPKPPPAIIDNAPPRPQPSRRRQSDSSSGILSWMAGKPLKAQYIERDSRGRERIILSGPRRQSAAVPPSQIYNGAGSESESESESEGRSRKIKRVSAEDALEIAIKQKKRRSRDEPRRHEYRLEKAMDPRLGIVQYGTHPVYTQEVPLDVQRERERKYQERLEEDLRKAGTAPEAIASKLQQMSDSPDARREYPRLANLSVAGAAIDVGAVKKSRGDEGKEKKEKMEEEQKARLSSESAAIEIAPYRKSQRDEEQEGRRAERVAAADNEVRSRPAVPISSASYAQGGIGRSRPIVTYYNEDRREERARLQDREVRDIIREKDERHRLREEERRPLSPGTPTSYKIAGDPPPSSRTANVREGSRIRRSIIDSNVRPVVITTALETREERRRQIDELGLGDQRYEQHGGRQATSRSRSMESDSEPTISDFSSVSGDEESTLVENKGGGEELHLSQQEAQAMMMNFLATFIVV